MKIIKDLPQHLEDNTANPEWLAIRAGKFTGSDFNQYLSIVKKGELSDSAESNLYKKVLESLGEISGDGFQSEAMARGNELEPLARQEYIEQTFNDVKEVAFVDWEKMRAGCSPDGVVYGPDGNIEKIIEIKCLPDTASILTSRGFVDIKTITENDIVAQYTKDGRIEFIKPTAVLHEKYNGEMYNFYRYNKLTMSCTPTHRIIYWNNNKKQIQECLAKDFPKKSNRRIPVGGNVTGSGEITDLIRFSIAVNADGHPTSNKSITFDFSKQRKIDRLLTILDNLGFEYRVFAQRQFENTHWNPSTRIVVKVKNAKEYKQGLSSICDITKISTEQANQIIQEIALWDGTVGVSNVISYTSINKTDIDFVAALCVIANRKSNVCLGSNGSYMITISGFGVQSTKHKPTIGFCETNSGQYIKKEYYKGYIHCVEVPSGMFIARMPNACPFVTGNCPELKNYLKMAKGKIPPLYMTQMQFNMLITGAKICDFIVYHPNMRLIITEIPADEQKQQEITTALEELNLAYDEILTEIEQYKKKEQ